MQKSGNMNFVLFRSRNTSDPAQRSAATIAHIRTNTHSNTQAVTSRGRPAVPHSLEGSIPSTGWLALQKPLIPLWTQPMVWKDQPWENTEGGVSEDGARKHFFFPSIFFSLWNKYWSGKIDLSGYKQYGFLMEMEQQTVHVTSTRF